MTLEIVTIIATALGLLLTGCTLAAVCGAARADARMEGLRMETGRRREVARRPE